MITEATKMIIVDFDGTVSTGVYRVYPATEDAEPDFEFQTEFVYGTDDGSEFENRADARVAAHRMASKVAKAVGALWATNE